MSRFEAEHFCHPLSGCIVPSLHGNQSKRLGVLLSVVKSGFELWIRWHGGVNNFVDHSLTQGVLI